MCMLHDVVGYLFPIISALLNLRRGISNWNKALKQVNTKNQEQPINY